MCRNVESRHFIPAGILRAVLTKLFKTTGTLSAVLSNRNDQTEWYTLRRIDTDLLNLIVSITIK